MGMTISLYGVEHGREGDVRSRARDSLAYERDQAVIPSVCLLA
jgi:hypothetical protein